MTLIPLVARELRTSARQPFTYGLRMAGVSALLVTSLIFGMQRGFGQNLGGKLFANLHCMLFCTVWILVPFLTADCLSRERREATLGLLFLTHLKAPEIVIAKGLAHGLRALTLWLGVLPVLTIPFILGGVSWHEGLLSAIINFSAICWALAAGLLGSAWSKVWMRAVVRAGLLSFVFLFVFWGIGTSWAMATIFGIGAGSQWRMFSDYSLLSGLGFAANIAGAWPAYFRLATTAQFFRAIAPLPIISLLALTGAILAAGGKTRRAWQEEPPSERQVWFERTFCTPIFWLSFFRRWMRRKLERNPIGWLEQRTWSGRLLSWAWLAVIVSLYSAILTDRGFFRSYSMIQRLLAWLLVGSLAVSAAGSFRRERETGVLELLLVSPLGENAIISGRLGGLWAQFFPSFALLMGIWMYFSKIFPYPGQADTQAFLFFASTFLCLPVIGLYFSLRCRNFIAGFLCTVVCGLLVPPMLNALRGLLSIFWTGTLTYPAPLQLSLQAAVIQVVIAVICWDALHRRLQNRAFPLERTT